MREAQLSTLFNSAFFELKKSNYICVQQPNELEFGLPNQLNFFFFIPETFRALSEHFFFLFTWNVWCLSGKKCFDTIGMKQSLLLEADIRPPLPPQWFKHYSSVCPDTLRPPRCARVSLVNIWWQQLVCGQHWLTSQDMLISLGAPAVGGPSNKVLRCCLWHSPVIGVHARTDECVHTPKVTMILFSYQPVLMQHQRTRR